MYLADCTSSPVGLIKHLLKALREGTDGFACLEAIQDAEPRSHLAFLKSYSKLWPNPFETPSYD
jgi:hypothetical protein